MENLSHIGRVATSIGCISVIAPLATSCSETKSAAAGERPNFVIVMCDDLGYGDIGCFGHPHIKTPNLDKLAAEGITMTDFYSAAPVSSPSRAGMLTGRNPNRAGIYDFIPGQKVSPDLRHLVGLQADEITIPALLKEVGYSTCLSGKWHCSGAFNNPKKSAQPDTFGFDHWFATGNNAAPSHRNPTNFVRNGEQVGALEGYSCQLVVDEAINWLENRSAAEKKNPFYLQVTFHEPHEPVASPEALTRKYLSVARNRNEAEYFANVENMDNATGRLIEYIEKVAGDNTLVLFLSDNGPETLMRYSRAQRSYGTPGQLRGMKLWTTEAGARVPGIMKWIGKETFNGETNSVMSSLDYLPTFCELAGAKLPKHTIDGRSFAKIFESQDGVWERDNALIWAFYNATNTQRVAMRSGDWKIIASLKKDGEILPMINNVYDGNIDLIKSAELSDFELFCMRTDIGETTCVGAQNQAQFNKMKKQLEKEFRSLLKGSKIWTEKR